MSLTLREINRVVASAGESSKPTVKATEKQKSAIDKAIGARLNNGRR
jgi:hypothetical protein